MAAAQSLRGRLSRLGKGKEIVVSIDDYSPSTIYNYASELGFRLRRKYTTTNNREDRTITVKRLS